MEDVPLSLLNLKFEHVVVCFVAHTIPRSRDEPYRIAKPYVWILAEESSVRLSEQGGY
jgi:hypothetical protein